MKGKMKKNVTLLCCTLAGACCLFGAGAALELQEVSGETTSVTMVAGAATRKDTENPGLKFTANISGYNASVQYGMLILPEAAFDMYTFNDDYVDVLDDAGKTYINEICTPYETDEGQWQIACSIVGINEENYTRQFVGIAYTLIEGEYDYADVNMLDNARSVTYVAQMALKYEANLTGDQENALEAYANPGCTLEETVNLDGIEDTGLTYGGQATLAAADNALAVDGRAVGGNSLYPFVTKAAYSGITEIAYDALIPEGYVADRVMLSFNSTADTYGPATLSKVDDTTANFNMLYNGVWTKYKLTVSGSTATFAYSLDGGNAWTTKTTFSSWTDKAYYMYFNICPNGNLNGNNDNAIIYFDNFSIAYSDGTATDNFAESATGGLFKEATTTNALSLYSLGEKRISLPTMIPETNNVLAVGGSINDKIPLVTKSAYSGITEITFDALVPSVYPTESQSGRVMLSFNSTADTYKSKYSSYVDDTLAGFDFVKNDVWTQYKLTVSGSTATFAYSLDDGASWTTIKEFTSWTDKAYYMYIHTEPKGIQPTSNLYFDNFSIAYAGGTATDNFAESAMGGLFEEATTTGALSVVSVEQEAVDYTFETLLASGDINSVLYNGGYAYVQSSAAVSFANLPSTSLAIVGDFTYTITGDKAFALVLGGTESGMDYLYIDGTTLAFYNGTTLKKSVTLTSATNTVYVAVTAGGRVCVSVNDGDFIAVGEVSYYPTSAFKVVALGGDGNVAITDVNVSVYAYSALPAYLSADEIEFTAYAPVTVENWGTGAVNPI